MDTPKPAPDPLSMEIMMYLARKPMSLRHIRMKLLSEYINPKMLSKTLKTLLDEQKIQCVQDGNTVLYKLNKLVK